MKELVFAPCAKNLSVAVFFILALEQAGFADILTGPITNAANGHVYFLLASANWTDSEVEARTLGGHLAAIRNQTEQNWIFSTFAHWNGTNRNLWIGLYDPDPSTNSADRGQRRTEFKWISGEPASYSNWSPVEPNNPLSSDTSSPELYGHIWNPTDPYGSYWNNYRDNTSEFGIEIDGVVEVIPPVNPLQITFDGDRSVNIFWKTETNKSYQLLATPDLLTPTPANFVPAVGADGTTNYIPDTTTLLNRGWTNYVSFVGNGLTNGIVETAASPKKFFKLVSFP